MANVWCLVVCSTWDRFVSVTKNCFASGYYTDSACTIGEFLNQKKSRGEGG